MRHVAELDYVPNNLLWVFPVVSCFSRSHLTLAHCHWQTFGEQEFLREGVEYISKQHTLNRAYATIGDHPRLGATALCPTQAICLCVVFVGIPFCSPVTIASESDQGLKRISC